MNQAHVTEAAIYSTFGDDPDLGEIIEMFVDEFPERISGMKSCFEDSDWDGLRRGAHQLRGAAGSYGFQSITDLSARLEKSVRDDESTAAIREALDDLAALCKRARPGAASDST